MAKATTAVVVLRAMGGNRWLALADGRLSEWDYGTLDGDGQYEQDEDEVREAAAEAWGCSPEAIEIR